LRGRKRMSRVLIGVIVALAVVGVGLAAWLILSDPEPTVVPEVTADEGPEEPSDPGTEQSSAEEPDEVVAGEDCAPTDTDYFIALGWFSTLSDSAVNAPGIQVGQTLVTGNNVTIEFPVAGGPAYFAAGAIWATGEPVEFYSASAALDSRAVDPPEGAATAEAYLLADSNQIEGTIVVAYGAGGSAAGAGAVSDFTATYDPGFNVVNGTISHPEIDLDFTAEGTVETRPHYPTAACYREAAEAARE
jgi:hypothetical protein